MRSQSGDSEKNNNNGIFLLILCVCEKWDDFKDEALSSGR